MIYDTFLLNAITWAREAGVIQLHYFRGNSLDIRAKINDSDIVTAADKAAERLIISRIRAVYPSHSILSEESGEETRGSEYRWVIDPLDGTTNFSNGLPGFTVSIGLEHNGETIVGVVYAPFLDEMFHASIGNGAFMNSKPIHPSGKTILEQSVISTGFPVDKATNPSTNNLDNVTRILPHVRGLRSLGSAAIDLCYVAAGFLDGYWESNLQRWDVNAAQLIAKEAGAKYTHFRSDRNISIVASTPAIHDRLLNLIS